MGTDLSVGDITGMFDGVVASGGGKAAARGPAQRRRVDGNDPEPTCSLGGAVVAVAAKGANAV